MYNFDSQTLKVFLDENYDFFIGARVQKIQQPTRREFVFSMRSQGETRKFYININPKFYHICFMSKENEANRFIEIPKSPPMFCMLLRKYLEGAKISKVVQPENERILEFYFETFNELSEKIYLCLAIELMGKHSNVVLYNYDTNVIIGCAHNVGAEKSREREMAGTLPYVYPSQANMIKDLSTIETFYSECVKNSDKTANTLIDDYYSEFQREDKIAALKNKLTTIINHKLKKVQKSLEKMESQLLKEQTADKYRLRGDLIMANLYNGEDYKGCLEVFDYENNLTIKIDLDETKTLKENAQRFYKLYTKSKTSSEKLLELTQQLRIEKDYCEQVFYSISTVENVADLLEIKNEIQPVVGEKQSKIAVVTELEIGGCKAYVGKNNKQNDYIVSKLAKEEDYWFHTKDCAGSHVLLKCEEPSEKLIFECAKLAKENSSAKNSSKVAVIYTKRKYLKKPPAANLGYVTYKFEKEILID